MEFAGVARMGRQGLPRRGGEMGKMQAVQGRTGGSGLETTLLQ